MKSGVQIVVNTADINRLDKDIYINLFNKYKERFKKCTHLGGKLKVQKELREDADYQKLTEEQQDALFKELM